MRTDRTGGSQRIQTVGVLGAGAMGAGIAQVTAQAGYAVWLYDVQTEFCQRGLERIHQTLEQGKAKGKVSDKDIERVSKGLNTTTQLSDLANVDLIIEAIPEDLTLKQNLFAELDAICQKPKAIFASNTSSISITAIGAKTQRQEFVTGLHFFNPVPMMKLVEVIQGQRTSPQTLETLTDFVHSLGKTPVLAKDTPGFIVNRVARPFYGEALKILGEHGYAEASVNSHVIQKIDTVMRETGGFRMGPFELMDLIGIDVNLAVTQSVYNAYFQESRYRPHVIQQAMVHAGLLGQKTGRGFYEYDSDKKLIPPATGSTRAASALTLNADEIFPRILAMIVNEAASALMEGVATVEDIDTAMRLGVNYPKGPFEWADHIGLDIILRMLTNLSDRYREERYRPMLLLQQKVLNGELGKKSGHGFYRYNAPAQANDSEMTSCSP